VSTRLASGGVGLPAEGRFELLEHRAQRLHDGLGLLRVDLDVAPYQLVGHRTHARDAVLEPLHELADGLLGRGPLVRPPITLPSSTVVMSSTVLGRTWPGMTSGTRPVSSRRRSGSSGTSMASLVGPRCPSRPSSCGCCSAHADSRMAV
jgi:hypothetical protein